MPGGELVLHLIPDAWSNNRLVVACYVVLGYFAFVDLHLFSKEIGGERLLQQGVAFVFLVRQDGAHCRCRPHFFPAWGEDLAGSEFGFDFADGHPVKEQLVDQPDGRSLGFVDDEAAVCSFLVSE